ncbi:FAD-dependent oxidoreductase [Oxalobacteraceae bacterium]|nr:FAD-dependent oxidoreductase [Oxalobacteraceae bacterium]
MAHSPLKRFLTSVMDVARLRNEHGISNEAALEMHRQRRKLLKLSAAGSAALLGSSPLLAAAGSLDSGRARIVVVGAGLGGLACAYQLKKAGICATVYEASDRLGGRCSSNTTTFPGQVAENGGELIDTGHLELRHLAAELGLTLDDLAAYDEELGGELTFWIDGARYTWDEQLEDFAGIADQIDADNRAAPFPQTYNQHSQRGLELDNMSVTDYITAYLPGGLNSRQGKLLKLLMDASSGIAATQTSALDLVGFFAARGSDERFHIRGGNDQLVTGMAATLEAGQIVKGHALTRLVKNADNSYTLTFNTSQGSKQINADHVVLALPFSILQSSVDYSRAGFDSMKVATIQHFKMGMHSKFQMQFNRRVWREQGYTGLSDGDTGYQISWEVTRAQPGTEGILTCFSGDQVAVAMNDKPLASKANDLLNGLDLTFPGVKPLWNGRALLNYWPGNQWSKGAYTAHPVGSYTSYYGYAGVRQGNCHFAGEHASVQHSGFLNGAVETGQKCAKAILLAMRRR